MEKCYSINGEEFNYTELEDAIRDAFDDARMKVGNTVTIFEADAELWKAGCFADAFPVDTLCNRAYDEAGEYADNWPDCDKDQEADLEQRIKDVVNQWADDYGLQPNFWQVSNVKKLNVKMLTEEGQYEILPEPPQ